MNYIKKIFLIFILSLFFANFVSSDIIDSTTLSTPSLSDTTLSVDVISGSLFAEELLYEKKLEEALKYSFTKLLGTQDILFFVDVSLILIKNESNVSPQNNNEIKGDEDEENLPGFPTLEHIFKTQPANISGDKKDVYNFRVAIKNVSIRILVDNAFEKDINFIEQTVNSLLDLDTKRGDSVIVKAVPFSHKSKDQMYNAILGQVSNNSISGWIVSFLILFIAVFIVISIILASTYHKENSKLIVNLQAQVAELKNIKEVKIPIIHSESQVSNSIKNEEIKNGDDYYPKRFASFRKLKTQDKISVLQDESPSVIAIVLAHLNPNDSADVINGLSPGKQIDVARSLGAMEGTQREVLQKVESTIEEKVNSILNPLFIRSGGINCLAEILSNAEYDTEKKIIDGLQIQNVQMANEVSKLMFSFDDLFDVDDQVLGNILRDIDRETIALSLKGASDKMNAKILKNLSDRMKEMIEEDVKVLKFVKQEKIYLAQRNIIDKFRELDKLKL